MPPPRRTVERARNLRRDLTPPEVKLWQHLRTRPEGVRFRRQHPLGPYVLDFYCPTAKLAVEVDGMAHDMGDRPERDAARDAALAALGIATLRIAAVDVMRDFESVARLIAGRCEFPLHHPADGPPPRQAGEECA